MANRDFPCGLKPLGINPKLEYFYASVTTAIFKGDVVAIKSSGRVHTVVTTTGSVDVIGVAAEYSKASNTPAVKIGVYTDVNQRFVIQADGATTIGNTNVGELAPLILTTGNTSTGVSKQELDVSSIGSGATTDPLRIVGFSDDVDNEVGVSHARLIVTLNRHFNVPFRVGV